MLIKNNNTFYRLFVILFLFSFSFLSFGQTTTKLSVRGSGKEIPRFVSLKHDKAYMRKGPSRDHPIEWVYIVKGLPLKVVSEYEVWRKVIDSNGTTGWMHHTQLSRKRIIEVTSSNLELRKKPKLDSEVIAIAEIGALLNIERCDKTWCRLSHETFKGWALRDGYYGLLENEVPN
tara:strand:- start:1105 stop:1629 length:525 start_codon:yes stop_codon:yes gene_type:complete